MHNVTSQGGRFGTKRAHRIALHSRTTLDVFHYLMSRFLHRDRNPEIKLSYTRFLFTAPSKTAPALPAPSPLTKA